MRDYRRAQQEECKAAGKGWSTDGLVFPDDSGKQRTSTSVLRDFRSLLREAGVGSPERWTTRLLRTSCVSLLSAHGIPVEVIALLVGRKELRPWTRSSGREDRASP
ncbi:hypothetical protein [Streptomyces sp. NBC_00096]|uniref:hypothetical protein n=1 Tax=Streptomyces sp. NBC_00096 TaxID=2975650 RepID=UPI00325144C6